MDVAETIRAVLAALAGIGIVIDFAPGIKLEPVRYIIRKLGDLLNEDVKRQLDKIEDDFRIHKIESWRYEILAFANSCMRHEKHTKEEFDHVIKIHDDYTICVERYKMKNGQVDLAAEYIEDIYKRCLEENSFLTGKTK